MNSDWKYELQADRTTLCACKCFPSAARVTSTNDSLFSRLEKTEMKFGWWLFQRKQYCCMVMVVDCLQQKVVLYNKLIKQC